MTYDWVLKVWEKGRHENVHATDPQFTRFKCPALMGITFTVSQMNKKDKELLRRSIESHGGTYSGTLDMETTEILIITKPEGDKFKYARKWKIPCLNSDYVFDSIEKGYCLPSEGYRIDVGGVSAKERASTPTKADETAAKLTEVSMCSTIMLPNETTLQNVNETVAPNSTTILAPSTNKTTEQLLAILDPYRVKRAGAFLNDLKAKFFLSGFTDSQAERIRKVLISAGSAKLNQLTKTVTHVIVASRGLLPEHAKVIGDLDLSPHLVSLQWLLESLQLGRSVPEGDFPAIQGQRNEAVDVSILKAMGPTPKAVSMPKKAAVAEEEPDFEDDLMDAYRNAGATEAFAKPDDNEDETIQFKVPNATINLTSRKASTSTQEKNDYETTQESQLDRFLAGKKLALCEFSTQSEQDLSDWVTEAGGEIVFSDFDGVLDYLVCPPEGLTNRPKFRYIELVSSIWLEDSLDKGELLDIEYHHRPIEKVEGHPCEGVVIGISNYAGRERAFIVTVAECLGMTAQEVFAKRDKKGVKRSTHLVCSDSKGQKYDSALRWGIPIVSKDWIMACLHEAKLISEKPFLLGDSKVFDEAKPMPKQQSNKDEPFPKEQLKEASPTLKEQSDQAEQKPEEQVKTPERPKEIDDDFDSLDIDKLKPKPLDIDMTKSTTPSRWLMASQPSPSLKRKRDDTDDSVPYFLQNIRTPDTPYGGVDCSSKSRKYWKKVCDDLGKHKWTDEQKRAYKEHLKCSAKYAQEWQDALDSSAKELKVMLADSDSQEQEAKIHQKALEQLKAKGFPVLDKNGRSEDGKTFDELMEEKFRKIGKSWTDPADHQQSVSKEAKVFKDVVIYVMKKCESEREKLHAICIELGGQFRHHYGSDVTHVIFHSNRKNDATKEFRQAREDGKYVVAPIWVYMSKDCGERYDEDAFPHTYNPKMTLSVSMSASKRPRLNSSQLSTQMEPEKSRLNASCAQKNETKLNETETPKRQRISSESEVELSANLAKFDQLVDSKTDGPQASDTKRRSSSIRMALTSTEATPEKENVDMFNTKSQASEGGSQIRWVDPTEEQERQKLADKLETQMLMKAQKENEQTFDTMELPSNLTEALEPPKLFLMSGIASEDQADFAEFLQRHHTESDVGNFDERGTHVVAQKMTRSEKMLGSIAKGMWVLHYSFMEACYQADQILPEADFEWGNPSNGFLSKMKNPLEQKLATAAFKSRLDRVEGRQPVFKGFKAIVHALEPRKSAFIRLLELGGAQVLQDIRPPFSDPGEATHLIAEPSKLPKVSVDYEALANRGVAAVSPLYLNEYLISHPKPSINDFLVDPIKPHWQTKSKK